MGTLSMESNVQRRLDSLSRHLLLSPETVDNHLLHLNHLGAVQLRSVDLVPVIVGGMVLDIHARPSIKANPRTTTPGKVQYVRGGVARNVAECMSKLGTRPYMISVVGLDMAGDLLLEHWKSSRLPIEGIRKCQDAVTPVVSIIFDSHGELAAGVASVEAVETFLTPEWICQFRCNILSAPVLMVDANVHPRSLEVACQIAAESHIPVWFEPVSVSKSKRIASIAQYVTYASPNEDELIAMANTLSCSHEFHPIQRLDKNGNRLSIESIFQMLKPAIWVLLEKGIKLLILTLGSYGVLLCSREGPDFMRKAAENTNPSSFGDRLHELVSSSCPSDQFSSRGVWKIQSIFVLHFPALPASVVSLTGAGDCLVGGTLSSICAGLDIMQSLAVGVAASKAAVETEDNIPPEYCLKTIADDAQRVFSAARVLFDE
ncbi:LOW QUALITY PROTEIN: pseudouridine kinase [Magnolia sinica]|uniref:LOW QUALITY PROTEIN: pseudouridine kinase n=1 Tax=Magnolia sinica TaxID=86752 RepID=UPI002659873F|nr:LOW QUALITY PROTEIN: pseudouridine kinase [Magnolia sinica]